VTEIDPEWEVVDEDTNELLYKLRFDNVDINRVVHMKTTTMVMYSLHKWIKSYNEKILPNLSYIEESGKKNTELKSYVRNLEYISTGLIPENSSIQGVSFVKQNYSYLKPNKVLTHNQALFTLLGLNTVELDFSLAELPTLNDVRPAGNNKILENILWETYQNFELKSCAYFDNGKITSENLIKFATEDNDFFSSNWEQNKLLKKVKSVLKGSQNKRQKTIDQEVLISELIHECSANEKHKKWKKGAIASWVSEKLLKEHQIALSEDTILRHYM